MLINFFLTLRKYKVPVTIRELMDLGAQFSRKGADLAGLQREVDTNRQLYELFYGRMRETAQTGDLESVNARIVQTAVVPTTPIKPRKRSAIMMALSRDFDIFCVP